MSSNTTYMQFCLGAVLGSLIACSPTKFSQPDVGSLCDSTVTNCVNQNGYADLTQSFKVGSGKVDILFVNDNSASMSKVQVQLAARFAGFIQSLDAKSIDYRIAITTTDLNSVQSGQQLITFGNSRKYLTNADTNRVSLFNNAILRNETIACEDLITSMFNTYGTSFQSNSYYVAQYPQKCPSSDTRGIYTANVVVAGNSDSFLRSDANLSVILISNDNVRQGRPMETSDTATAFTDMMNQKHAGKYWDFNSIVVKDAACKQAQTLKNAAGQVVMNQSGPAIAGGLGLEYANLSNSAARDIDNNLRPRGKILDICQSDYAQHFRTVSTQLTDDARMLTLKCTPTAAPEVTRAGGGSVAHTWSDNRIVFPRGTEGTSVSVSYRCYTGPT